MKWIAGLSFLALINVNLAIGFESRGFLLIAIALAGMCLSPIFASACELGAMQTRPLGVSETYSSNMINTGACVISACQILISLQMTGEDAIVKTGLGLVHITGLAGVLALFVLRRS